MPGTKITSCEVDICLYPLRDNQTDLSKCRHHDQSMSGIQEGAAWAGIVNDARQDRLRQDRVCTKGHTPGETFHSRSVSTRGVYLMPDVAVHSYLADQVADLGAAPGD